MIENFNAVDEWIEKYESLNDEGRYELIKETFQSEVPEELLEEADMGDALIYIKEYLINNARIQDFIELVDTISSSNHKFYKEEAPYLFSEIISYYLLKNNIDKIEHYLQPFLENPISGIDDFLLIFKKIVYYGQSNLAYQIAEKCWRPVAESPEIIGGVHEFLEVIYYRLWERIYSELKSGKDVDAHKFLEAFTKREFIMNMDEMQEIIQSLQPQDKHIDINFSTDKERRESIKKLRSAFIKSAFENKNMSFVSAALIFDLAIRFWVGRELSDKDEKNPEKYFSIVIEEFDDYLGETFRGFIYNDNISEAALLWGMPYIYEFLEANGVISKALLETVVKQMHTLKSGFKQKLKARLWEISFVHRWTKPNYMSEEDFKEEAKYFEESLHTVFEANDNDLSLDSFSFGDEDFFDSDFFQGIKSPSKAVSKKKEKAKKKAAKQQKKKNRK